jgi:hypothetical protein
LSQISRKARQIAARDVEDWSSTWLPHALFPDRPVSVEAQLFSQIIRNMKQDGKQNSFYCFTSLLLMRVSDRLLGWWSMANHEAGLYTLETPNLHFAVRRKHMLRNYWDRSGLFEKEIVYAGPVAAVYGAFIESLRTSPAVYDQKGMRWCCVALPSVVLLVCWWPPATVGLFDSSSTIGIFRTIRLTRPERSAQVRGATSALAGLCLYLTSSHFLATETHMPGVSGLPTCCCLMSHRVLSLHVDWPVAFTCLHLFI